MEGYHTVQRVPDVGVMAKIMTLMDKIPQLRSHLDQVMEKIENQLKLIALETNREKGKALLTKLDDLFVEEESILSNRADLINEFVNLKEDTFFLDATERSERKSTRSVIGRSMYANSNQPLGSIDTSAKWEINPKDIVVDDNVKLGVGQFGTVFKGKLLGKEVAVKKLNVKSLDNLSAHEDFMKEVKIMSSLRHPNLLLFMGVCTKLDGMMMVMEFMAKGSVYGLLHPKDPNQRLSFKRRMLIARDAAQGMSWLHQMDPAFLHLDLKTANILVDENFTAKVADFGLSQLKAELPMEKIGSPLYMGPEMLRGEKYDASADVYSFGIVLWELATEQEPYSDINTLKDLINYVVTEGKRLFIPDDFCDQLRFLLQACWHADPHQRITFANMLKENMFEDIIIDQLITKRNSLGRIFWRQRFPGKWNVPWPQFKQAFTDFFQVPSRMMGPDDIRWPLLQNLLRADAEGSGVSIEMFSSILEWFGPFDSIGMLDKILDLCKKKYFYGHFSSKSAEKVLSADIKNKGTFLIRLSASDPGSFALSVVRKDCKIQHFRILRTTSGRYMLGKSEYDSLESLIRNAETQLKSLDIKLKPNKTCSAKSPLELIIDAYQRKAALAGYWVEPQEQDSPRQSNSRMTYME
eukprot:TRINITY_DN12587_c0_g1_i2.p1 TRINITY_DN12587_c0_g1~~TRINITY_DN12587_c0_g1_i2.p1  ORF type:complete len:647 (-),score=160.39 TRINITY_DN12587_c0_g1_i2:54-1964(-)